MTKEASQEAQTHHSKDYIDPPPAPLIDLAELKLWSFYRALIAEFIATLLFLYVTVATVIGHKSQTDPCGGVGLLGIAWAFGGMIFILVYCTAGISGRGNILVAVAFMMARTRGGRRARPTSSRSATDATDLSLLDHPGPVDPVVLHAQATHRSSLVWEGEFDRVCEVRHHRMWDLDPRVAPYVARMGFYAWTMVQNMRLDHALITALVERWRSETHTFHFRGGEMTVTLQDVGLLTGLPVDGRAVTGNEFCDDWGRICERLLGRDPERGRSPYYVHLSWFAEHMAIPPDDADEDTLMMYARAYVLCMLCTSLLTDSTGNEISLHYLRLLEDIDVVPTYSWGGAVLACLYRQLCTACVGRHKQIGGALLVLQFWCWERMPLGRPQQVGLPNHQWPDEFDGHPRMLPAISYGRWAGARTYTQSPHQVLLYYRDHLDRQSPGDLSWEPYHDDRFDGINELCIQGRQIWTAEVPLICFHIVEWHYPSRVMRQFGWQPLIPDPPRDGHSDLHKVSRRKGKLDWSLEHHRWIAAWEQREDATLVGSDIHDPHMHSSYMAWYDRITRRIIQPTHFHMNAYQPTAGERTTLLKTLVRSCKAAAKIFLGQDSVIRKVSHDLFHACRAELRDMNELAHIPIDPGLIRLPEVGESSSVRDTEVDIEPEIRLDEILEEPDIQPQPEEHHILPRQSTRTKRDRVPYSPSAQELLERRDQQRERTRNARRR